MPIKQSDFDALYKQLTNLIPIVTDLNRQLVRYIRIHNDVVERYARIAEEYDNNRLATEEIRELIKELVEEMGTWAQYIGTRMDRVEEYTILVGMGKGESRQAQQITQQVSGEHLERTLREDLAAKQNELITWQRNIQKVKQAIAEMGYETIENSNREDDYQRKIDRLTKEVDRLREALRTIEG